MSLVIYTDKSEFNGRNFIEDVEYSFSMLGDFDENEYNRYICKRVEQGEYLNQSVFTDRFGVGLYVSKMSTSSKAFILLGCIKDSIINLIEVGRTLGDVLLKNSDGFVYIPKGRLESMLCSDVKVDEDIDVVLDKKHFKTYDSLMGYVCDKY